MSLSFLFYVLLIAAAGALAALLLAYFLNPLQRRISRITGLLKKYRSLIKKGEEEKTIWLSVSEDYYKSLGLSATELGHMRKEMGEAWLDYKSREDLIRTEKTGAGEFARRVLILQYGKGKDLGIKDTEKIYELVEIALQRAFKA